MGFAIDVKTALGGLGKLDVSSQAIPGFGQQPKCASITRLVISIAVALISLSALVLGIVGCVSLTVCGLICGVSVVLLALCSLSWAVIILKRLCESREAEEPLDQLVEVGHDGSTGSILTSTGQTSETTGSNDSGFDNDNKTRDKQAI
ncbi:hypothetical protein BOKEGFJH_00387 [Chlamydia avium]|uniref:Inclusion membrane protein G n=1 Tax=Chlamydia avium TaxID=1457141 RepID=A0ABN0MRU9_9CHLA|nr:hypothetical protein [Chlamydia avium]EPP37332.1 hypothetical protein CP10743SC13_0727 [Chlamydia psittaci 10_743_SC13]EPP38215.1 hypothetical protein CP10881SC42_0807 [Chlamydia avium]VVT42866.1 hypothetical protein BOKEGFJH_00387 [Chlamydia avium]